MTVRYLGMFDLFTIGVGPSSSHTVGPMRAARDFVLTLGPRVADVSSLEVELYGSLAATGRGHNTLAAVVLGLEGYEPKSIPLEVLSSRPLEIEEQGLVRLSATTLVKFRPSDITLSPLTRLARHTNAIRIRVLDQTGRQIEEAVYYSVGGGFIERDGDSPDTSIGDGPSVPHPYESGAELLATCAAQEVSISEILLRNEVALRSESDVRGRAREIRQAMEACVRAGLARDGELPGGLGVRRRAPAWHIRLLSEDPERAPENSQKWVNLIALAVNEENASGGRVVTAPTNGAAGIVPAVLHYALGYTGGSSNEVDVDGIALRYLLVAAGIGALFKKRASISGAEMGCQGEVGSASSMAAGALAEILGGTPAQVENAAEIALEHNLGLTCDPVGGLVQIPCIERNAIAAAKAINAAKMALYGDGVHRVSLDMAITAMRETGEDMSTKYKETSTGGLAVSVVEC